jgi:hypothetical protein
MPSEGCSLTPHRNTFSVARMRASFCRTGPSKIVAFGDIPVQCVATINWSFPIRLSPPFASQCLSYCDGTTNTNATGFLLHDNVLIAHGYRGMSQIKGLGLACTPAHSGSGFPLYVRGRSTWELF